MSSALDLRNRIQVAPMAVDQDLNRRDSEFTQALGRAALARWGELSHDMQQLLFESAADAQDDAFREALAIYLHNHHPRTAS